MLPREPAAWSDITLACQIGTYLGTVRPVGRQELGGKVRRRLAGVNLFRRDAISRPLSGSAATDRKRPVYLRTLIADWF